jgi:hypothetical protein
MAYATLAQLRAYLKLGATETADDALLTDLLARAQQAIDTFCARTFEASADTTRYCDADRDVDGYRLVLDADLCAITSVVNGNGETIAATDYVTEPRNRTPYYAITLKASKGNVWEYDSDPENAIAITGKWAYATTAPADITHACIRLAAFIYRQKDSQNDVDRPLITGDGVTILPSALPRDVQQLLSPYRRVVFG